VLIEIELLPPVNDLPPCISNIGNDVTTFECDGRDCAAIRQARRLPCHRRKLRPRHHLFLQGDLQDHVYFVTKGAIRLYALLENGRRQIVEFKFPGDFILFDGGSKYRFNAQAITATELRSFPLAAFDAAAGHDARFMLKLYEAVGAELARARNLILVSGQRRAEGCMAALLLDMADRAPPRDSESGFVSLPVLRGDIADYVGLSHETVSRIFSQFKKSGLIDLRGRSGLKLIDRAALAALADWTVGGRRPQTVARASHRPAN
jgi:CRP/FNR family transcriptional regulator